MPNYKDKIAEFVRFAERQEADAKTLREQAQELRDREFAEMKHKFEFQRQLVQDAHEAFHELVGPEESPRFQHSSEEEFNPAAQMRRIAAARDESRAKIMELELKIIRLETMNHR